MFKAAFFLTGLFIATSRTIFAEAASSSGTDWVNYLLNGGPFAVVVLLMVLDKLTTTSERDRLRAENAALRDEIKVLNESIRQEIVPPLVQMNELMRDVVSELSAARGVYYPPGKMGK